MEVQCCQFLHNFENKSQLFQGNYQNYARLQHETYGKGGGGRRWPRTCGRSSPCPGAGPWPR